MTEHPECPRCHVEMTVMLNGVYTCFHCIPDSDEIFEDVPDLSKGGTHSTGVY